MTAPVKGEQSHVAALLHNSSASFIMARFAQTVSVFVYEKMGTVRWIFFSSVRLMLVRSSAVIRSVMLF